MSRNYKTRNQEKLYFLSFATVNWIDMFIRPVYKDLLVDSLNYCIDHKGLELYAWCIMTSHVHLVTGTQGERMEAIIRGLKRHTAKAILKAIAQNPQESRREWMSRHFGRAGQKNSNNEVYQFWQQNNQPIELSSNIMIDQKLRYVHQNQVEAGFCTKAEAYPYSSALDYAGRRGLVKINFAN